MSADASNNYSLDDLRSGEGRTALAGAEVVIAVDEALDAEEVIKGKWDWDLAVATAREEELAVVRVQVDMSHELDELRELVDAAPGDT